MAIAYTRATTSRLIDRGQKTLRPLSFLLLASLIASSELRAQTEGSADEDTNFIVQEIPRSLGFYLHTDQDAFQNAFNEDRNYTMGVSIGVFGELRRGMLRIGSPNTSRQQDT